MAESFYWTEQRLRGRGGVRHRLDWLRSNTEKSAGEIADIQAVKLRDTIEHAYRTVPYYRQVMSERGLRPADIGAISDLAKLPVLTRHDLLARNSDLVSEVADQKTLQRNYSSGSTGVRAEFLQDADFRMWMRAHQLRTYEWCAGWQLGDPFVLLWGSEIYWSLKQLTDRAENLLTNRREFNTFRLAPDLIRNFLDNLVAFQPALVSTYSNAMHLIAGEAENRGVDIPGLQAIQGTSEPFPAALRKRIESAFGCATYDKYGMRETNIVHHESPDHDGMLIQAENVVVEILDDKGEPCPEGVTGRVVVTTLNNRSMPLIRYETSDLASLLPIPETARYKFPRMSEVNGRKQDLIVVPGGGHVDAYFFSYLFMQFSEIHWFQVEQEEAERLTIRVYAPNGISSTTVDALQERIHSHTGFPYRISLDTLAKMPESATGKFRLCISHLADGHTAR